MISIRRAGERGGAPGQAVRAGTASPAQPVREPLRVVLTAGGLRAGHDLEDRSQGK